MQRGDDRFEASHDSCSAGLAVHHHTRLNSSGDGAEANRSDRASGSIQRYLAIVSKCATGFEARIREFPELIARSDELLRCADAAEKLLRAHVDALLQRGATIPLPSPGSERYSDTKSVVFAIDIALPFEAETIRLAIDPCLARRIDKLDVDRTTFVMEAIANLLGEREASAQATDVERPAMAFSKSASSFEYLSRNAVNPAAGGRAATPSHSLERTQ